MATSPPRRSVFLRVSRLALVLLAGFAGLLAGCGGDGGGDSDKMGATSGPATLAPPDAALYAEALVRPSGDVEEGVTTAARRVLRIDDPGRELRKLLDDEIDGERGLYTREIEPWLGDTIGVFLLAEGPGSLDDPDGGLLFAVRDSAAVERMMERMRADGETRRGGTVDGVAYDLDSEDDTPVALLGEYWFAGSLPGLRAAVAASKGSSLADADRFTDAVDSLPTDRLVWAWLDPGPLVGAIGADEEIDPAIARALESDAVGDAEPVTVALTARADELVLDVEGDEAMAPRPDRDGAVSIRDLPGDAWFALATPVLGPFISDALRGAGEYDAAAREVREETGLDLDEDILSWLGGVSAYLGGTSLIDLDAGVVLGSRDETASRRLMTRLRTVLAGKGLQTTPTTGAGDGLQVRLPDFPVPIVALAEGDRVAVALGLDNARDALDPSESFADGEPGKSAIASLGEGFDPSLVLVVDPLLNLLASFGLENDPDFQSALPYLSAYTSLAAGTKRTGGRLQIRVVVTLRDDDESNP